MVKVFLKHTSFYYYYYNKKQWNIYVCSYDMSTEKKKTQTVEKKERENVTTKKKVEKRQKKKMCNIFGRDGHKFSDEKNLTIS